MQLTRTIRNLLSVLAVGVTLLGATYGAIADTLHLKDGRVLEGAVVTEGDGYVFFKYSIGSIEKTEIFPSDQIAKLVKDADVDPAPPKADAPAKPGTPAKPGASKPADASQGRTNGAKTTRIAILNFGPPSDWHGEVESTVGIEIAASAWREVIPLLEADNIDVVVVRVNSGGGMANEVPKFQELFENEYKPRFRTVCWIESAISAAAMSPWVIEEMYFFSEGNIGACTAWSGNLVAAKGFSLELYKAMMERASALGKRDPKIMLAMQVQEPLSASIDPETGAVTYYGDTSGDYLLNPPDQVYTMTSDEAMKYKFGAGVANTPDELARAMGYTEYEFAGKRAADFIDDNMRTTDRFNKRLNEYLTKYNFAIGLAQGQPRGSKERGAQVGRAKRFLAQMRRDAASNPNFALMYDPMFTDEWFFEQEEALKDMVRDD